jgi:hypothetical protein
MNRRRNINPEMKALRVPEQQTDGGKETAHLFWQSQNERNDL